jgi:hypothetical protein
MKFKITQEEAINILEMHSKMRTNRPIISEQTNTTTEDPDLTKLKRAVAAGCLTNGVLRRNQSTNKVFYRKPSVQDPSKTIDFFADMTYRFTDGSNSGKWKCDGITTEPKPELSTQPKLTPQQQRSVDDKITFYNKGPEPLYQKEQPTADQITKKEWEKVNLKTEKGFEGIIDFDYYIWKKTGLRQTQSPQQVNAIKIYTDAGWQDIGGKVNPAEAAKYDTIDLKDIYPEEFPESYKLVKTIDSVDTNEIIKELNTLVGTKNFGDRKTCRDIISKYNVAKQKNAPINDALLRNWKMAVNACKTKVSNFNDLNTTKTILGKLVASETEIDKRWNIDITKPSVTPPVGGATPPAP